MKDKRTPKHNTVNKGFLITLCSSIVIMLVVFCAYKVISTYSVRHLYEKITNTTEEVEYTENLINNYDTLTSESMEELATYTVIVCAKHLDTKHSGAIDVKQDGNVYVLTYSNKENAEIAYNVYNNSSAVIYAQMDGLLYTSDFTIQDGTETYPEMTTEEVSLSLSDYVWDTAHLYGSYDTENIALIPKASETGTKKIKNAILTSLKDQTKVNNKAIIAVIDSGATGVYEHCYNAYDGSFDVTDTNGHGTKMINIITTALDSLNANYEIIPIKIANENGIASVSAFIRALEYLDNFNDINIVNMSFTSENNVNDVIIESYLSKLGEKGVELNASAGNSSSDTSNYIPAKFNIANVVASCDENGNLKDFSNKGVSVDYYIVSNSTSEACAYITALDAVAYLYDTPREAIYAFSGSVYYASNQREDNRVQYNITDENGDKIEISNSNPTDIAEWAGMDGANHTSIGVSGYVGSGVWTKSANTQYIDIVLPSSYYDSQYIDTKGNAVPYGNYIGKGCWVHEITLVAATGYAGGSTDKTAWGNGYSYNVPASSVKINISATGASDCFNNDKVKLVSTGNTSTPATWETISSSATLTNTGKYEGTWWRGVRLCVSYEGDKQGVLVINYNATTVSIYKTGNASNYANTDGYNKNFTTTITDLGYGASAVFLYFDDDAQRSIPAVTYDGITYDTTSVKRLLINAGVTKAGTEAVEAMWNYAAKTTYVDKSSVTRYLVRASYPIIYAGGTDQSVAGDHFTSTDNIYLFRNKTAIDNSKSSAIISLADNETSKTVVYYTDRFAVSTKSGGYWNGGQPGRVTMTMTRESDGHITLKITEESVHCSGKTPYLLLYCGKGENGEYAVDWTGHNAGYNGLDYPEGYSTNTILKSAFLQGCSFVYLGGTHCYDTLKPIWCSHQGTYVDDNGNTQTIVKTVIEAATCVKTGLEKCSRCQATFNTKLVGHSFGSWVTDSDATCIATGSKHRDCTVCGYRETETIPYTGHSSTPVPDVAATCTTTGLTGKTKCSVCGVTCNSGTVTHTYHHCNNNNNNAHDYDHCHDKSLKHYEISISTHSRSVLPCFSGMFLRKMLRDFHFLVLS